MSLPLLVKGDYNLSRRHFNAYPMYLQSYGSSLWLCPLSILTGRNAKLVAAAGGMAVLPGCAPPRITQWTCCQRCTLMHVRALLVKRNAGQEALY